MPTTVNNSAFDAALAAIPAPYGPLTRTGTNTDLNTGTRPAPNSDVRYLVMSAAGVQVYISYDELSSPEKYMPILKEAHGLKALLNDFKEYIAALNQVLDDIPNPLNLSAYEVTYIFDLFQGFPYLMSKLPHQAYYELGSREDLVADFTVSVNNTSRTVTFNNNTTGDVTAYLWSFGDGTISRAKTPPPKVYNATAPASFTIRLLAVGPRGISTETTVVNFT